MSVTTDTLRLMAKARAALDNRLQLQTHSLTAAWVTAWNDVAGSLNGALTGLLSGAQSDTVSQALMLRSTQLLAALALIADRLDTLSGTASQVIATDLPHVVADAGAAQTAIIASQLPAGGAIRFAGWARVSAAAVDAIVQRATGRVVSDLKPLSAQAYAALRAELIRGVLVGDNPRTTAARMVRRAEYRFNGGLTRALTVARTEMLDAHRAGSALSQQQSADVLAGWRWLTNLDTRTCPSCVAMNGRVFPLAEPGPADHQNGRCARVPVTRPWSDLGVAMPEPPDVFPDAAAWFAGLSPAEQRTLLGSTRFEAWKAGSFPLDTWATKRPNPGWRDAYYTSPVPPASGSAAA